MSAAVASSGFTTLKTCWHSFCKIQKRRSNLRWRSFCHFTAALTSNKALYLAASLEWKSGFSLPCALKNDEALLLPPISKRISCSLVNLSNSQDLKKEEKNRQLFAFLYTLHWNASTTTISFNKIEIFCSPYERYVRSHSAMVSRASQTNEDCVSHWQPRWIARVALEALTII